jgi:hypothetical protein
MKVLVALSLALTTLLLAQTPGPGVSSGKHPFTFEDMMKLKHVGSTRLPTMRNADVFRPMANDSSGHRKQPIRRKFGCAILTPEAECWLGNHGR